MTSQKFEPDLLKQEVLELTEMLRNEEILEDLRTLLQKSGIDPQQARLAGFLEDASGFEGGVLIASDGNVYCFERNVLQSEFSAFHTIDDPTTCFDTYPALRVALEMDIS